MDKRKYKGVAFWVGLLFFIALSQLFLLGNLGRRLAEVEQEHLGALMKLRPELEKEFMGIFQYKHKDGTRMTQEEEARNRTAGRGLQEKYGYPADADRSHEIIRRYGKGLLLTVLAGMIGLLAAGFGMRRERKKRWEEFEQSKEEQHRMQLQMETMKERTKKEENDTKQLITDISHQLKTPIAALKMSYEIFETTDLTEEERRTLRQKEQEGIKRLESLTESLMNVSRLEAKLIQIHPVWCSLKETLIKAVNSIYMKAYEKEIGITLNEFEDEKIPHDSKWTAEAIVNILDNAIKYSDSHTNIRIRVSGMVTYVLVEIMDEGIGIPEKETHMIFQRFYRGENRNIQEQDGSGVGLYLTRKIVEEQGGSISVKADNGRGSNFRMTLPRK